MVKCKEPGCTIKRAVFAKPGDKIEKGAPLFTLHTDESDRFERAKDALIGAVKIEAGGKVNRLPLVLERI